MRLLDTMFYGQLLPDQPDLGNPGIELARNALPRLNGYDSLPEVLKYGTTGLPERAIGAGSGKSRTNETFLFAGLPSGIYLLQAQAWSDVSRPVAYQTAERWEFVKWKESTLATHVGDKPQQYPYSGGTGTFVDVTADDVQGAHIAVVRSFVVLGDTVSGGVSYPERVRWCGIDDPTTWTPDPQTLSDFQDLTGNGGRVIRITGGEFGVVLRERSIHRMTFVGPGVVFQFDEVDRGIGALSSGSVVQHGDRTFFWSEDGVRYTTGDASVAIGEEQVDISLLSDLDSANAHRITGEVYSDEQIIVWAYPGQGNIGGWPNRLAIYNYGTNRWATGDESIDILFQAGSPFTSIDGFDDDPAFGGTQSPAFYDSVDDIPGSLDDDVWAGGKFGLGGITSDMDLGLFNGPPRPAQFETSERQISPGARTRVSQLRSLSNNAAGVAVSIGHRNTQESPIVWEPDVSPTGEGIIPVRIDDRFLRFLVTLSGGFDHAVGLEVYGEASSGR